MRRAVICGLLALMVGLIGCGYSGSKGANSDKDRPKTTAEGEH